MIVIVLGVLVVGFLDDNSFVQRVKYDLQIDVRNLLGIRRPATLGCRQRQRC